MTAAENSETSVVTRKFCPHVWAFFELVQATFTDDPDDERVPLDQTVHLPVPAWELETLDGELADWPMCDVLILAGVVDDSDRFGDLIETDFGQIAFDALGPVGP